MAGKMVFFKRNTHNLRIPLSLHRDLAKRAAKENVSLNMLATYLLSMNMGHRAKMK